MPALEDISSLPVRWFVPAHLDVWPLVPVGQPRLRDLQRPLLLPVRQLQLLDGSLQAGDLLHRLTGEEASPSSPSLL